MSFLLAHHLEPHHVPILAVIFVAGVWIGWQQAGRFFRHA